MQEEVVDEVGWEQFNFGIKVLSASVIETASSLELVFTVLELLLKIFEVFVGFEFWISFSYSKDLRKSTLHGTFSFSGFLWSLSAD